MQTGPDLSTVAALIGDPARAVILSALLGGQSLPASELAYRAIVTPQTASMHLAKLVQGGLLEVQRMGRHRYYRLKNADVARALEALLSISPPARVRPQPASLEYQSLCFARTCYDHLAGKLGVAVTQGLIGKGLIIPAGPLYTLTGLGSDWLATWGVAEEALHKSRRWFARACLDWSERQDHLAGALGAAVAARMLENGWVRRIPGTRALQLTDAGRAGLLRDLGVSMENMHL